MIAKNNWQETVPILPDEDNKFLCRKSTLVGNQPNLNEDMKTSSYKLLSLGMKYCGREKC